MDSKPHHTTSESGGFWSTSSLVFGIALCGFALISGAAFILGGVKYTRGHGAPPPASAPPATAAAPAAGGSAPAAPATTAAPAVASGGEIVIKPGTDNPLTYDVKSFTVKAGQKVKVTFNNQSALPQPHNFILGKLGSKDRLMAAFATMITDPNGMAKGYIPESPDIIIHTKLLMPGTSETLDFTAPAEKGDYPYLCSFPGHAMLMNGVMKVE